MQVRPHAVFAAFSIENTRENTPETRFRTGTSYAIHGFNFPVKAAQATTPLMGITTNEKAINAKLGEMVYHALSWRRTKEGNRS